MLNEGNTVDFVLDLNMATGKTAYTDDVGCDEPKLKRLKVMTVDEEQSSLKPTSSRELSEFLSSRVGLRWICMRFTVSNFLSNNCLLR